MLSTQDGDKVFSCVRALGKKVLKNKTGEDCIRTTQDEKDKALFEAAQAFLVAAIFK